jgi:hypothetical protein
MLLINFSKPPSMVQDSNKIIFFFQKELINEKIREETEKNQKSLYKRNSASTNSMKQSQTNLDRTLAFSF